MRVRRDTHAEVHVRLGGRRIGAAADSSDPVPLRHDRSLGHGGRCKLKVCYRIAVVGADRHADAAVRYRSDEGHGAAGGGNDVASGRGRDVDSAVLTAGVRVGAQVERAHHGSIHGPSPGVGGGGPREYERGGRRGHQSAHRVTSRIVVCEPLFDGSAARRRCLIRRRTRASQMCANCVTAAGR